MKKQPCLSLILAAHRVQLRGVRR